MATMERPRPPPVSTDGQHRQRRGSQTSVRSFRSTASSIGPPPSSPTIIRTADCIILPSVPTHEPEDGLPSPREYHQRLVTAVAPSPTSRIPDRSTSDPGLLLFDSPRMDMSVDSPSLLPLQPADSQQMDTEEVEELRDDDDDSQLGLPPHEAQPIPVLLSQLHKATGEALCFIIRKICANPPQPSSPVAQAATTLTTTEMLKDCIQRIESDRFLSNPSSSTTRSELSKELAQLSSLLAKLPTSEDAQLATALGALCVTLENVSLPSDDGSTRHAGNQAPSHEPQAHVDPTSGSVPHSPSWTHAALSEELRNPFVDTFDDDVFDKIHRQLTTICSRISSSHDTQAAQGLATLDHEAQDLAAWDQLSQLLPITHELVSARRARAEARAGSPTPFISSHKRQHSHSSQPDLQWQDHPGTRGSPRASFHSAHSVQAIASVSAALSDQASLGRLSINTDSVPASLPPAYCEDDFASQHRATRSEKDCEKDQHATVSLPSYTDHLGQAEFISEKKSPSPSPTFDTEPRPAESRLNHARASTSAYAARSPEDLAIVQNSIERLYSAIPQLVDQRVTMSPQKLREVSLQKVLDKLADTDRLDDQRVDPPTPRLPKSAGASPVSPMYSFTSSHDGVGATRGKALSAASQIGRKFSVSSLANSFRRGSVSDAKSKGKEKESERSYDSWRGETLARDADTESLSMLVASVQRAQGLALDDQRTEPRFRIDPKASQLIGEMPIYTPTKVHQSSGHLAHHHDGDDDSRLFDLLNNTGQSRLADQDAKLLSPSARHEARRQSQPVPLCDNGSALFSSTPEGQVRPSDMAQVPQSQPLTTTRLRTNSEPRLCESGLRLSAEDQSGGTADLQVDSNLTADRARNMHTITYVAESQANLNNITVLAWVTKEHEAVPSPARQAAATTPQQASDLFYQLQPSTLPTHSQTLHLSHAALDESVLVSLPSSTCISAPQQGSVPLSQDHFSIKLVTSPSPQHRNNNAASEPVTFPLSAEMLRQHRPNALECASCGAHVVDTSGADKYRPLPSQHWEELVDAWMCHGDQELNASVARGKQGLEEGRFIPRDEVWVGDQHLLVPGQSGLQSDLSWRPEDIAPTSEYSAPLSCRACGAELGATILLLSSRGGGTRTPTTGTLDKCTLKLFKYAIRPVGYPRHTSPLALYVAAQMLETSRAHAAHHFLVQEAETGSQRLLLWLFHPHTSLSASNLAPTKAIKVLFQVKPSATATAVETITFSASRCDEIQRILERSNDVYPRSRARLAHWLIGWLPRLDETDVAVF